MDVELIISLDELAAEAGIYSFEVLSFYGVKVEDIIFTAVRYIADHPIRCSREWFNSYAYKGDRATVEHHWHSHQGARGCTATLEGLHAAFTEAVYAAYNTYYYMITKAIASGDFHFNNETDLLQLQPSTLMGGHTLFLRLRVLHGARIDRRPNRPEISPISPL